MSGGGGTKAAVVGGWSVIGLLSVPVCIPYLQFVLGLCVCVCAHGSNNKKKPHKYYIHILFYLLSLSFICIQCVCMLSVD